MAASTTAAAAIAVAAAGGLRGRAQQSPTVRQLSARCSSFRGSAPAAAAPSTSGSAPARRTAQIVLAKGVRSYGTARPVGGPTASEPLRVLAFEDNENIPLLLTSNGIDLASMSFKQHRDTKDVVARIKDFAPDVLLLDFYIPPYNGLAVLQQVNAAVKDGVIPRPRCIVGMSSVSSCNELLLTEGADAAYVKWDVHRFAEFRPFRTLTGATGGYQP